MNDDISDGSGNVFADLGLTYPEERQTKTRLALAVNTILHERKLRQIDAAKILGIPQPRVSLLNRYRLNEFSIEKLIEFLTALNQDVEIAIRPRANAGVGAISVLTVG